MTYDGTVTVNDPSLVESFDLPDGRTAYLLYDQDTPNPRDDYDHAAVMVQLSHRAIDLDDGDDIGAAARHWEYHRDRDTLVERYARIFGDAAAFTRWDTRGNGGGESWGYAWITRETADREGDRWDAAAYLDGEVSEFQSWAAGEVYGVIVTDADGEETDSLWGLIGTNYAESMARSALVWGDY